MLPGLLVRQGVRSAPPECGPRVSRSGASWPARRSAARALPALCAACTVVDVVSHAQVGQEEYNTFFTTTFREFLEPLAQTHFTVEGTIEFSALLFVPGMAPFEQQVHSPRMPCLHLHEAGLDCMHSLQHLLVPNPRHRT